METTEPTNSVFYKPDILTNDIVEQLRENPTGFIIIEENNAITSMISSQDIDSSHNKSLLKESSNLCWIIISESNSENTFASYHITERPEILPCRSEEKFGEQIEDPIALAIIAQYNTNEGLAPGVYFYNVELDTLDSTDL